MSTIWRSPSAAAASLARTRPRAPGRTQSRERCPVLESSWLAGQDGNVVPGIVDGLVAAEPAGMLGDDLAVLADHDAVGIGLDFDGPTDRPGRTEYLLLSKRTRQVFETAAGVLWKPSNRPA